MVCFGQDFFPLGVRLGSNKRKKRKGRAGNGTIGIVKRAKMSDRKSEVATLGPGLPPPLSCCGLLSAFPAAAAFGLFSA